MKEAFKRVLPIVLLHIAAGFVWALVIAFRQDASVDVLPPFEAAFKMQGAVIRLAQVFPALIAAGLLTGYSIAFRKLTPEDTGQRQAALFPARKSAYILCIVLAVAYALLAEGAIPLLKSRQEEARAKTAAYNSYMLLYRTESEGGNFRAALANAEAALAIWKESPKALEAADAARLQVLDQRGLGFIEEKGANEGASSLPQGGYDSLELLERAQEAAARSDFYNAHYYAALSWRMTPQENPSRDAALRLASESWNRITGALDEARVTGERRYYERKIQGYANIQEGDFLSAYYHFLAMQEEEEAARQDPDIAAFLEVARQGVLQSFFFIDETQGLNLFEQGAGIFFTLPNSAGGKDAVLIGGAARRSSDPEGGAYFRNLEIARFGSDNRLSFQILAPYAKMQAFTGGDGSAKPELILTAIDKSAEGARIEPQVIAGNFPPRDALSASVLTLDMPYEDMALLIDSSAGAASMTIPELLKFMRRAERYGFERAAYIAEFAQRVAEPFFALAMAVLALVWAQKFQLKRGRPFSAWWVIPIPLIAIVCVYATATARYAFNLCITFFAAKSPSLAIPCTAALLVVLLFAASCTFFRGHR